MAGLIAMALADGRGERQKRLARDRAEAAVPFRGRARIDLALSTRRLIAMAGACLLGACSSEVPILGYHWLDAKTGLAWDGSPGAFREHMDELQRLGYTTLTLGELCDHLDGKRDLPERPVVITFDDGAQGVYDHAFPILRERGMKAELFVVVDAIGSDSAHRITWNVGVGAIAIPMLVWPEVREMSAAGTIHVGSHTITHESLATAPFARARWEIAKSKLRIEEELGLSVPFFAYPKNSVSAVAMDEVRKAGYRAAVAGAGGMGGRHALFRTAVHAGDGLDVLRRKLARSWADSW